MAHPNASWFDPDKLIKDILWNDIGEAANSAHGRLLDVGCGAMPYKPLFRGKISDYTGIDKRSPAADIREDFLTAKIPSDSYDTVLSTQVIEHVPDPHSFLKRIHQVLGKNGTLILTAPLIAGVHEEPNDFFRFTEFGLRQLLAESGFDVIRIVREGNWISANATQIAFHMESTCNRFFLRYPKKIISAVFLLASAALARLPNQFTKPEKCPMNYLVIAKKR